MKNTIDKLTFGYLEKKWKRLFRTIWFSYGFGVIVYQIFEPKLFSDDGEIFSGLLFFFVILISYVLEPFIIKTNPNEKIKDNLEIGFSTKEKSIKHSPFTNDKDNSIHYKKQRNEFFITLKSYFFFDGSYISGNRYYNRKFLQWFLVVFIIGFYVRGVTTYCRSRSLKISILGSYIISIYSFFIDIYIIVIFPINAMLIGVVDEMLWVFIFPILPLTYLWFSDGKEN